MKSLVENIHETETTSRGLKSKASGGVSEFSLFGDNVGKVVNVRLVHLPYYLFILGLEFYLILNIIEGLTLAWLTKVVIYRWP